VKNPFKACLIIGPLGCLGFVAGLVVLVIFFYVEEDWRAAHEWAALKAKWEAKGVSFDRQAYTPAAVPDEQNLAAIPLFELEPDSETSKAMEPLALQKATRVNQPGKELPASEVGSWQKGEPLNIAKIQETIAKSYTEAFPNSTPPADMLAQLDALYPFMADLREASKTRPLCRFNEDYGMAMPAARPLGPLTAQIRVSKILTLHANLALAGHQPDIALADLQVNFKLMSGLMQDPSLVGGLVAVALNAIATSAIFNGIVLHSWNDAQLAALEDELGRVDFLQNYQFVMRSEAIAETVPNYDIFKKNISYRASMLSGQSSSMTWWIAFLEPLGWVDFNKISTVEIELNGSETVDPKAHRMFPGQADDLINKANEDRWDSSAPWSFLYTVASGPVVAVAVKFAQAQVWIDETRIACALERYRLAHDAYPASLDTLAPAYIPDIPRDIMTGDPYHYVLRADGTFLLYSVGWNQLDDGGQAVYKKDVPTQVEPKEGDWVWPTPQVAKP
jgi:hypothetical protein